MEGKVCLVTGGAQGIGKSYCSNLLKNGAKVVICDINESAGKETVQEFKALFGKGKVDFYVCDVTDPLQFKGCFEKTVKAFGGLDMVINNAGICDETDQGWRKMVDININGLVEGTKLGFKFMSRDNGGRGGLIVNIASITCLEPWECSPVYSASKAAVNQLSRSYGTDIHYKDTGVKVIAINPGLTETSILDDVKNKSISEKVLQCLFTIMKSYPIQKVESMGKGLIQVIKTAANGSLWTIEDNKPPQPSVMKY